MLLWIAFSIITAGAVGALLRAARRAPQSADDAAAANIAVYADQLSQIDEDVAKGLLSVDDAQSARAEVARRLIGRAPAGTLRTEAANVSDTSDSGLGAATMQPDAGIGSRVPTILAILLPVAALGLYIGLGSPSLPGQPHALRSAANEGKSQVELMISKVEMRLAEAPEDGNGWDVIAPIYLNLERYAKAAQAYANANRILGETPKRLAGFAQSEILANNGIVTPNARTAAERLLLLEPKRLDAKLWLTLAKEQDGQLDAALADYATLLKDPGASPAMRTAIEQRMAIVTARAKGEPIPTLPSPPAEGSAEPMQPGAAPSASAQQDMIEGMVARLAGRLAQNGADPAGWSQLVRSYMVLERRDDALKALKDARGALASDAAGLKVVNDEAAALGVESPPQDAGKD